MRITQIDIACKGYLDGNPSDGYEHNCDYEKADGCSCDDCVCNYGTYNPETGRTIPWFLRIIQNRRARKHYINKENKHAKNADNQ